jgi:hypothetical protein
LTSREATRGIRGCQEIYKLFQFQWNNDQTFLTRQQCTVLFSSAAFQSHEFPGSWLVSATTFPLAISPCCVRQRTSNDARDGTGTHLQTSLRLKNAGKRWQIAEGMGKSKKDHHLSFRFIIDGPGRMRVALGVCSKYDTAADRDVSELPPFDFSILPGGACLGVRKLAPWQTGNPDCRCGGLPL